MLSRRRFLFSAAVAAPALTLSAQRRNPNLTPANSEPQTGAETPLPAPVRALTSRRTDIVAIGVDERNSRLDTARDLMKEHGMNAALITTGASLLYFTGARWGQSERLFAYILPQSAAPFIVCPYLERDRLKEAMVSFPERETTLSYLWQESDDPYAILRAGLEEAGVTTGVLGVEEHTQFAFANAIASACPALKIVSAMPVTAGCRSLKSPAEIALLRLANSITFEVYRAVYRSCGPGDTNQRVSELVGQAYERCGVHGDASCNVGVNSAVPHGSSTPQTIHEGEMVMIDDGCFVEGYQSDITRSFVYGKPSDLQRKVFTIVRSAQSAALAAARPGVTMQAVDAAARSVILQAGYGPGYDFFTHRVGHGIGLDMHEWPYLVGGNPQKIAAGMVFSDEPGIYLPDRFGVRLEDDMHITDAGAELFTPQSPSLEDPFGTGANVSAAGSTAITQP